jgi:hypothetical protein
MTKISRFKNKDGLLVKAGTPEQRNTGTRNTGTPEQRHSGTRNTGTLKILNLLKNRKKIPGGVKVLLQ